MHITYKLSKDTVWILYDQADISRFKVDLYLKMAEMHGAHLIEVDKQVNFIKDKKKVNVKLDIVIYNEKLSIIKIIVITDLNKESKNFNALIKHTTAALEKLGYNTNILELIHPYENKNSKKQKKKKNI